jgi:hypothetical protein
MTRITFSDVGTASSKGRTGGSFLIRIVGLYGAAIVFQCILNQDVDGAPTCYARFNPATPAAKNGGLDFLRNGTSDENATFQPGGNAWEWHGVVSRTEQQAKDEGVDIDNLQQPSKDVLKDARGRFPVFQPGHKFYVSSTSLVADTRFPATDQRRYWDATAVSYGAITPPLRRLGVGLGDFGFAIRNDNGVSESFFYADAGAQEKVGEVSTHLFNKLFPGNNQENHPVTFIVFPDTSYNHVDTRDREIRARLFWLSQADNISELIDAMALGQSFDVFRSTDPTTLNSPARQNILRALKKYGQWHFFKDRAYNVDVAEKTPNYIKWIEWAKQRS